MYRVLIAEDEREIRAGLRLKVDWESLGFTVAGEADNGKEALAMLRTCHYDLLLTDIRMPFVDGIELLETCSAEYPAMRLAVLTGYDDFSFVKNAIKWGAKDYLLKPVVTDELQQLLRRIKIELDEEESHKAETDAMRWNLVQALPLLKEQFVLQMIKEEAEATGQVRDRAKMLELEPLLFEQSVRFISVEMQVPEGRLDNERTSLLLMRQAFQMTCREIADKHAPCVFAFFDWSHPNLMHFIAQDDDANCPVNRAYRGVEPFAQTLKTNLEHFLQVRALIGTGRQVKGAISLKQGYLSALSAWSTTGKNTGMPCMGAPRADAEEGGRSDAEFERSLRVAMDGADAKAFGRSLAAWVDARRSASVQELHSLYMRVLLVLESACSRHGLKDAVLQELQLSCGEAVHSLAFTEVTEQLTQLAARIADGLKRNRDDGKIGLVGSVKRYIDEHYSSDLGLVAIAAEFHIHSTYLSELFKKQYGVTFTDYIVSVRLSKAKQLLEEKELKLAHVAELSGFANVSYFSSVFRKHVGVSPAEYRQRHSRRH